MKEARSAGYAFLGLITLYLAGAFLVEYDLDHRIWIHKAPRELQKAAYHMYAPYFYCTDKAGNFHIYLFLHNNAD